MRPDQLTDSQRDAIRLSRDLVAAELLPWKLADGLLAGPGGAVQLRYLAADDYAGSILIAPDGSRSMGPSWNRAEAVAL